MQLDVGNEPYLSKQKCHANYMNFSRSVVRNKPKQMDTYLFIPKSGISASEASILTKNDMLTWQHFFKV